MPTSPKVYSLCLLATLFGLVCLPALTLRQKAVSERENRALAQRPDVVADWGEWPRVVRKWEAYFHDQYGLRNEAIRLSEGIWGRLGLSEPPAVVRGRDDWLFLGTDGRANPLRDYAGANLLTEIELRAWLEALQRRHQLAQSLGKEYVFFIAPNKAEIYGRYLPSKYRRRVGQSRCEQLVAYVRRHSEVPIIYARSAMEALRSGDNGLLGYAKGGTHWNLFGAPLGQYALGDWLEERLPGVEAVRYDASDFVLEPVGVDVDLARMIGLEEHFVERAPVPRQATPSVERVAVESESPGLGEFARAYRLSFHNQRSDGFLAFGDSFFENLLPYLGHYFGSGIHVPARPNFAEFQAAVEAFSGKVVIEQRVERMLAYPLDGDAEE